MAPMGHATEEVVGVDQRDLQLVDEQMHVVARIADQRHALRVAGHIASVRAGQQQRRIVTLIQVRRSDRPTAIQTFQVRGGRPVVAHTGRIGAAHEWRAISGDVVRDELPQKRPPGRDRRVRAVTGAVANAAGGTQRVQQPLVARETRQPIEQPRVPTAVHRSIEGPSWGKTVISRDGRARPGPHKPTLQTPDHPFGRIRGTGHEEVRRALNAAAVVPAQNP